ncbi:MAG: hypothetical protein Faunusvirus14_15 [Faunusvirus sp.]|jgi:hypothetical protein|uniref:Uncharacterized protein n=1 Tax=Faunusvirus sp. TaxID=2487766 RepID=A0A3G4ZX03_9VIRU|nr:MAG: hypothetical protein Faunusvirus14_15 [Faunusvirus sp.]
MTDHSIIIPVDTVAESNDEKLHYYNKLKSQCLIVVTIIITALIIANCVVLVETSRDMNNSYNVNTTAVYTDAVIAWHLVAVSTLCEIIDITTLSIMSRMILNNIYKNMYVSSFLISVKYFVMMMTLSFSLLSHVYDDYVPALYNIYTVNQFYNYIGFVFSGACTYALNTNHGKL